MGSVKVYVTLYLHFWEDFVTNCWKTYTLSQLYIAASIIQPLYHLQQKKIPKVDFRSTMISWKSHWQMLLIEIKAWNNYVFLWSNMSEIENCYALLWC